MAVPVCRERQGRSPSTTARAPQRERSAAGPCVVAHAARLAVISGHSAWPRLCRGGRQADLFPDGVAPLEDSRLRLRVNVPNDHGFSALVTISRSRLLGNRGSVCGTRAAALRLQRVRTPDPGLPAMARACQRSRLCRHRACVAVRLVADQSASTGSRKRRSQPATNRPRSRFDPSIGHDNLFQETSTR